MKGSKPIRVVSDLMQYLQACPPNAEVILMPETGEGYPIGGVLEFNSQMPAEVWILIDEFESLEPSQSELDEDSAWVGTPANEVSGDAGIVVLPPLSEKKDVVTIRGKMRSA